MIPCAVVAGGTAGGVRRENFNEVLIEFERYLDSDEYTVGGDGTRTVTSDRGILGFQKTNLTKHRFNRFSTNLSFGNTNLLFERRICLFGILEKFSKDKFDKTQI